MLLTEWNQDEAVEVAREEGIEQEKFIIAKNLLAKGSTLEFVSEITGLGIDEIERIKQ